MRHWSYIHYFISCYLPLDVRVAFAGESEIRTAYAYYITCIRTVVKSDV